MLAATRAADSPTESRREMSVARRRPDLAVPEELADHREALPKRKRARREAVPQVVDPHVSEPGPLPHPAPVMAEVRHPGARLAAGDDPRAVRAARQRLQHAHRRR